MDSAVTTSSTQLSDAIVVWTGWGETGWPSRDESRVVARFGEDRALDLMPAIRQAKSEFYESDARYTVEDLAEMGEAAAERFRKIRPDIRDDAVRALAWCYTYDFK